MICTNGRELVTPEQIRILNQLSWDKKHYANFKFANDVWGLEITFYLDGDEYRYKVECRDETEMHLLRAELDERTKLIKLYDGRLTT